MNLIDDVPVFLDLMFQREDRPRALTITVAPSSPVDLDDLIRFNLASRPFIRDLVSDRIVILWQLMMPGGLRLHLRPVEQYEHIEELARLEIAYVTDELMRLRRKPLGAGA